MEPGTRIGCYEVVDKLGEGGMGEVFRARDASLNRDVAVKVLPAALADDPDRLARFKREAQVLASLNHPNVAHVYGFEAASLPDGSQVHVLAMELVEGEDLAERLERGAVPADEAIAIARQIAEGLEDAHRHGVIHRDLKPANVKVTADGRVKVLDFGLAKALDPGADQGVGAASHGSAAATMTSPAMTAMGMILGTAAYMSPEQARGRPVDHRADIWSFGVVLFEMLAGRTLFSADTVGDTLAAVLREEIPWSSLPSDTPRGVVRLLRRCLNRDPRRRLHSAADATIELDEALTDPDSGSPAASGPAAAGGRLGPWMVAGLLALALVATWSRGLFVAESATPVTQVKLELSPDEPIDTLFGANAVLSPDGRTIAFVTQTPGNTRLSVRRLDQLEASPLDGTEGAHSPFFSPDSKWIGFQSSSGLQKIGVAGGAVVRIADTGPNPGRGATWSGDTIVFSMIDTGLLKVPADGSSEPVPLTTPDEARDERSHRWPSFLPDGRTVLFMVQHRGQDYDDADIEAVSLDDGRRTLLVRGGAFPRYAPGALLFVRNLVLHAAPFDTGTLRVDEPSTPVLDGVLGWTGDEATGDGSADYALSDTGDLLYRPAGQQISGDGAEFVWIDRNGRESPAFMESIYAFAMEVSPDGRYVAIEGRGPRGPGVFIKDLERGTLTPLTTDGGDEISPAWSPDSRRLAYTPRRSRTPVIHIRTLDGSEPEREILTPGNVRAGTTGWTLDGALIVGFFDSETANDIGRLPLDGSRVEPLAASIHREDQGRVSPDGRWLAYESDEKGLREVFVASLETSGPAFQVSSGGGRAARWSRDGTRLYFVASGNLQSSEPESVMEVSVDGSGPTPTFGAPREVFRGLQGLGRTLYDTHKDGRMLYVKRKLPDTADVDPGHVILVTGWAGELARRFELSGMAVRR